MKKISTFLEGAMFIIYPQNAFYLAKKVMEYKQ